MGREYTRRIATLGNVPSHGPFILFDDFESILKWTKYEGEGDAIFELNPSYAYQGSQSLHMVTRTTETAPGDSIGATLHYYMLPSKKLNTSILFRSSDFTKMLSILFYYIFFDGTNLHQVEIKFLPQTPIWQYKGSDELYHNIPNSSYSLYPSSWHRFQLLADLNTDKYIAAIIDHNYHDLSNLHIFTDTNPTTSNVYFVILATTDEADPCDLSLDDFLAHEL